MLARVKQQHHLGWRIYSQRNDEKMVMRVCKKKIIHRVSTSSFFELPNCTFGKKKIAKNIAIKQEQNSRATEMIRDRTVTGNVMFFFSRITHGKINVFRVFQRNSFSAQDPILIIFLDHLRRIRNGPYLRLGLRVERGRRWRAEGGERRRTKG